MYLLEQVESSIATSDVMLEVPSAILSEKNLMVL